jgi:glutathione S-transferase
MIKVFGHPASTCTRKVLATFEEKGATPEFVLVDFAKGEHKAPAHVARQPFGKLPAIEDEGFVLYESRAIVRYLDKKLPGPSLTPTDLREYGRMEQFISFEQSYASPPIMTIVMEMMFGKMFGKDPDMAAVEKARETAGNAFDVLDATLQKQDYLVGKSFTLADLSFMPYVEYLFPSGSGDLITSRQGVNAWWTRVSSRPSWKKVTAPKLRGGRTTGQPQPVGARAAQPHTRPTRQRRFPGGLRSRARHWSPWTETPGPAPRALSSGCLRRRARDFLDGVPSDPWQHRAMPTLELTYFDAPGRAEPIRVALHIAGLPFTDRRLKFPEFAELKAKGAFPLGSVPLLSIDGVQVAQTGAILRWIARSAAPALYPADARAALDVDTVLDAFNDTLSHALVPSLFERDTAKKLEMRRALADGPMARVFSYAEGIVARSEGPFVAGREMSIADLVVTQQILQIRAGQLDGITAAFLAPYPRLAALADAYAADARIVAYGRR